MGLAVLLEYTEALGEAAHRGGRRSLQQQQVLIQTGHAPSPREELDGVYEGFLLTLSLTNHLQREKENKLVS